MNHYELLAAEVWSDGPKQRRRLCAAHARDYGSAHSRVPTLDEVHLSVGKPRHLPVSPSGSQVSSAAMHESLHQLLPNGRETEASV